MLGSERNKAAKLKEKVLAPAARGLDLGYSDYRPAPGGSPPQRAFRLFACGFDLLVELFTDSESFPSLDKNLSRQMPRILRKNLLWGGMGGTRVFAHAIPTLLARLDGIDDPVNDNSGSIALSAEHHLHLAKSLADFYPLTWGKEVQEGILVDCLAAFELSGSETLSGLVEETRRATKYLSAEGQAIQARNRERMEALKGKIGKPTKAELKGPRLSDSIPEPLGELLRRPPKVDEPEYGYARDFFINQASLVALEWAMLRERTGFPEIQSRLLTLTPSEEPEVLEYRSHALQAWIRGTRAYWECARHEFSSEAAVPQASPA